MISPAVFNPPAIDKGCDYDITLTIQDANANGINIANHTIVADLREAPVQTANEVVANGFTVTKTDAANGVLKLSLTKVQTANITHTEGYYDIKLTNANDVTYAYVKGRVDINTTVTDIS